MILRGKIKQILGGQVGWFSYGMMGKPLTLELEGERGEGGTGSHRDIGIKINKCVSPELLTTLKHGVDAGVYVIDRLRCNG